MIKTKKTILILAGLVMLTGCRRMGSGQEVSVAGGEAMTIKDITINTSVRKTGQYPEEIIIILDRELPDDIAGKLKAGDFAMAGHADSWMNPKLHEFEASFGEVETAGNTVTLYPEAFPEKFFYVKDFKVECSGVPDLSFTYDDVSKIVTPVADDFTWVKKEEGGFDYRMFTPDQTEKLPVVIVFHGYGDTDNLLTYRTAVAWAEPENQLKRPCYVIAPIIDDQAYYTERGRDGVFEKLKGLLDEMISDGRIDPDRIYVSGNSFGGMSSIEFAEEYPDTVAGILAMCPALNYSPRAAADIEKIRDISIRFAQAEHDGTIPIAGTRAAYEKLKSAGAVDAGLKEYSDDEMNAAGAEPSNEATYSYHHVELAVMEDESYMQWLYER
ncbi:MAG: hypothetical protein K5857_07000 [Lachnospiraceae bacterium]|nr:hypothetical protein [Lachnospiraceae bacterium]